MRVKICSYKLYNMEIAIAYSLSDGVYTFDFGNGKKQLFPQDSIILVDDESGLIAIKSTSSRKTLFLAVPE